MKRRSTVRKAVFPAAGLGTRFLPATKAVPKEMLPLVDKPVIQYVIEEAVASGIESIVIVTGRGKSAIEDHFDISFELEDLLRRKGKHEQLRELRAIAGMIQVSYVRQKEPLGLGHAVLAARDLVGDEPFAVFLGDDIIHARVPVMRQMMGVFARRNGSVVAVEQVARERTADYGIVAGRPAGTRLHRVTGLVEKPLPAEAPSDLAIVGRYILTPEIFSHLETTRAGRGGEIQLTDGLLALLRRQPIYAYRFLGTRYDTGDKLGFLKATVEYALRHPRLGRPFRGYLEGLDPADHPPPPQRSLRRPARGRFGRGRAGRRARS